MSAAGGRRWLALALVAAASGCLEHYGSAADGAVEAGTDGGAIDAPFDAGAPGDAGLPLLSVEGMVATACVMGTCPASSVIAYWRDQWDTYAVARTVTFRERAAGWALEVTDADGAPASLDFEIGRPVTLTVVNPGDATSSGTHSLTGAPFFHSVAWLRAEGATVRFLAPRFDAFEVIRAPAMDRSVRLQLVPMRAGTFDLYCADEVTRGDDYAAIVAGEVVPDLETGHAGRGMRVAATVTGELELRLEPEIHPGRDPALDRDPRRASTDAVWADGARDETYRTPPVEMHEVSGTVFEMVPSAFELTIGRGAVLGVHSAETNTFRHTFSMHGLYATSVLEAARAPDVVVRAPYLVTIDIAPGASAEMWLVPTVAGTYFAFCQVGVRTHPAGWPVLTTGHAGRGMRGTVRVSP